MSNALMPGGYTDFRPLTPEDKALFEKVMSPILGVEYEPTQVATQVVSKAINYKFRAIGTIINPSQDKFHAVITIIEPSEGDPVLESIVRV